MIKSSAAENTEHLFPTAPTAALNQIITPPTASDGRVREVSMDPVVVRGGALRGLSVTTNPPTATTHRTDEVVRLRVRKIFVQVCP